MSAPVTVALVTDTHTWPMALPMEVPDGGRLHVNQSEPLLHLLLHELAAAAPDLAIHLGDMTNGGGYFGMPGEKFAPHLARVSAAWQALPFPVYALPGNHDCPPAGAGLPEAAARVDGGAATGAADAEGARPAGAWRAFEQIWGLPRAQGRSVDVEHALLLLVNAQGHSAAQVAQALPNDPVYGWISDGELERVEQELAAAGDRPVIVCLHQLLLPWNAPRDWQEFYRVANGDHLLALMEKFGNVRAVFQGHAHFYEVHPVALGGRVVPFVVAPAVIEYPVGWLQLSIDARGLDVALRELPAGLDVPEGQEWRAGRSDWRHWQLSW